MNKIVNLQIDQQNYLKIKKYVSCFSIFVTSSRITVRILYIFLLLFAIFSQYCNNQSAHITFDKKMKHWNFCDVDRQSQKFEKRNECFIKGPYYQNCLLSDHIEQKSQKIIHQTSQKISLRSAREVHNVFQSQNFNKNLINVPDMYKLQPNYSENSNKFTFKSQQKKIYITQYICPQRPFQSPMLNRKVSQQFYYPPSPPTIQLRPINPPNIKITYSQCQIQQPYQTKKVTFTHQPFSNSSISYQCEPPIMSSTSLKKYNSQKSTVCKSEKRSLKRTKTSVQPLEMQIKKMNNQQEYKKSEQVGTCDGEYFEKKLKGICQQNQIKSDKKYQIKVNNLEVKIQVPELTEKNKIEYEDNEIPHTNLFGNSKLNNNIETDQDINTETTPYLKLKTKQSQNLHQLQCIKAQSMLDEEQLLQVDQFSIVLSNGDPQRQQNHHPSTVFFQNFNLLHQDHRDQTEDIHQNLHQNLHQHMTQQRGNLEDKINTKAQVDPEVVSDWNQFRFENNNQILRQCVDNCQVFTPETHASDSICI